MPSLIRDFPKRPPGGHHFVDEGVTLTADSVEGLIEKIRAHRATNARPLGDPEQEVAEFYQRIAPYLVSERREPSMPEPLNRRMAENIMAIWYGRYQLLHKADPEAERRSAICQECPLREADVVVEGNMYFLEADRRAVLMTNDQQYLKQGRCKHHNWPVAIGVRLMEPQALAIEGKPSECWVPNHE